MKNNFLHVWGLPIVLAILSIFGLLSALLGSGIWEVISWIALFIPLSTMAYYLWIAFRKKSI